LLKRRQSIARKSTKSGNFISEVCFDYGRCDRKLPYAVYKDWTGMGGTKFPLKHKAFAKRLRSHRVGDGGKAGKQRFWPKIALRDAVF
jgi:hypothetical protein